jgi:hypothetical protein
MGAMAPLLKKQNSLHLVDYTNCLIVILKDVLLELGGYRSKYSICSVL